MIRMSRTSIARVHRMEEIAVTVETEAEIVADAVGVRVAEVVDADGDTVVAAVDVTAADTAVMEAAVGIKTLATD